MKSNKPRHSSVNLTCRSFMQTQRCGCSIKLVRCYIIIYDTILHRVAFFFLLYFRWLVLFLLSLDWCWCVLLCLCFWGLWVFSCFQWLGVKVFFYRYASLLILKQCLHYCRFIYFFYGLSLYLWFLFYILGCISCKGLFEFNNDLYYSTICIL